MWVTHHFVGSKALVSHLATVGSMRGMTQAITKTIRMDLVSYLQRCMAVYAGSLQALNLSVNTSVQVLTAQSLKAEPAPHTEPGH